MVDIVNEPVEPVETKIFKTRVAEEAKRYDDMANFMTEVLDQGQGCLQHCGCLSYTQSPISVHSCHPLEEFLQRPSCPCGLHVESPHD